MQSDRQQIAWPFFLFIHAESGMEHTPSGLRLPSTLSPTWGAGLRACAYRPPSVRHGEQASEPAAYYRPCAPEGSSVRGKNCRFRPCSFPKPLNTSSLPLCTKPQVHASLVANVKNHNVFEHVFIVESWKFAKFV